MIYLFVPIFEDTFFKRIDMIGDTFEIGHVSLDNEKLDHFGVFLNIFNLT